MHYYIKVYDVFFSCFHNYVSKNALLDMYSFLIFGHIYKDQEIIKTQNSQGCIALETVRYAVT